MTARGLIRVATSADFQTTRVLTFVLDSSHDELIAHVPIGQLRELLAAAGDVYAAEIVVRPDDDRGRR